MMPSRRHFVRIAAALAALSSVPGRAFAQRGDNAAAKLEFGRPQPFSFEGLIARAKELAARPYAPPARPAPAIVDQIDYQTHGQIRFRPELALFANGPGRFPVTFFHVGRLFPTPVRILVIERGQAREVIYEPTSFEMPADSPARKMPSNAGFAGFRFQEARDGKLDWKKNDWVAFLGASYFRAIGELYQYGLSARGIAIDPAVSTGPEEFPDFTHFYIQTPKDDGNAVTVYALLDGPSVASAFRFVITRTDKVVMEIEQRLFLRKDVTRFGIAPLTSMFWFGETVKPAAIDWRPEVHDSDGLALWTGVGERIWRPLNNPPRTIVSSFADENPRGFGLLQRDRVFDHYQDGVRYERRPSLWVEPLNDWGKGAVQLIEIPTDAEIHDNIVAAWVPAAPARAGQSHIFKYRLVWAADEPSPSPLAQVVATRLGHGDQAGLPQPKAVRKFVVEFKDGPLASLPSGVKPEAVLWASRGTFSHVFTELVPNRVPGHWRAQFNFTVDGTEPVEMRLFLRNGEEVLSETWLYQHHPP